MALTETVGQEAQKFIVNFINPVTKLLHSSHKVTASNPAQARQVALDTAQTTLRGSEIPHLATYDIGLCDGVTGDVIHGLEKVMTKAQIQSQVEALMKQLSMLDDDGETPGQKAAVQTQLGGVPRNVTEPPKPPAQVQPSLYTPPQGTEPTPTVVDPSQAPNPNAGSFTQAQVDAMIADARSKAGGQ
jgi:hypothetical protein